MLTLLKSSFHLRLRRSTTDRRCWSSSPTWSFTTKSLRHSLRGYDTALPRPDDQAASPSQSDSEKMSPQARPGSVKVAPLPGILRVPTETFGNRGRHRYHHHHHHHRHQRRCETIVEEHQLRTDHQSSDVANLSTDDVTERRSSRGNMSLVIQQPDSDVKCTADVSENANSGKLGGEGGKSSGCEGTPNDLSDSIAELRVSSASFRKFSTAV